MPEVRLHLQDTAARKPVAADSPVAQRNLAAQHNLAARRKPAAQDSLAARRNPVVQDSLAVAAQDNRAVVAQDKPVVHRSRVAPGKMTSDRHLLARVHRHHSAEALRHLSGKLLELLAPQQRPFRRATMKSDPQG